MAGFFQWLRSFFGGGKSVERKRKLVVIDPGHGGRFSGAVVQEANTGRQITEKSITLDIALQLRAELEWRGWRVKMTREEDVALADEINADLEARAVLANEAAADLFISIHCNSSDNPESEGIETYHFPGSEKGGVLARSIQSAMMQVLQDHVDRGVKAKDFVVLRLTNMPSVLIETEFMSNPRHLLFLLDPAEQGRLARAIADGVGRYFEGAAIT